MDLLVRFVFVAHHPAVRRAWWRADEEESLGVRCLEELALASFGGIFDGRVLAKVYAAGLEGFGVIAA